MVASVPVKTVSAPADGLPRLEPRWLESGRPMVLRQLAADWPAVQAYRSGGDQALLSYLGQFESPGAITVYSGREGLNPSIGYRDDFSGFNFERAKVPLSAVLTELENGPDRTLYVNSARVEQWLKGFKAQNNIDFGDVRPTMYFWLGNRTVINAHNDSPQNLACCVAGRRTFTLFPPDQIENLYLGPVDANPAGRAISLVDFDRPDFERFPRFATALSNAMVAELEPGDALIIPSLWWHHVKSHDSVNMLINYWWSGTPAHMGVPDLALDNAILALRGLPKERREAWRAIFDYYVFGEYDEAIEHIPERVRGMLDSDNPDAARAGWLDYMRKLKS